MNVETDLENITSEDSNSPEVKKEVDNLIAYWGELLNSQNGSDFTVAVEKEGTEYKEIYAHQIVLKRFPHFTTMFGHKACEESKQNRMIITDIEYDVVYEMLRFIYTSKVQKISIFAGGLLVAAEKYDIQGLKDKCQKQLIRTLEVENAADMLILSDVHRADQLKKATMKLIDENFELVQFTRGWKEAKKTNKLGLELFEYSKSFSKRPKLSDAYTDITRSFIFLTDKF